MEQRIPKGFEMLWEHRTSSAYYELSTEDIARRIELWDHRYGVEVVEAGKDFARLRFLNLTISLDEFRWEATEFCPQLVMGNDWHSAIEKLDDSSVKERIKQQKIKVKYLFDCEVGMFSVDALTLEDAHQLIGILKEILDS